MSAVTSEEKMANPYEAWGELFVSDVIAQPGRHKVEAEGELHKRLSLFASYCMENATTAGDALLVNDLIDAARLVRLDKEAAIAKVADRPDLPGVPDGWQTELIDAASDILDWHVYPDLKGNGDFELVTQFPSSAVDKGTLMWKGWMRLRDAILAARASANPAAILSLRSQLEAAIEAKVAEERERCARIADEHAGQVTTFTEKQP